jgi:PleD family two-component response regulator
VAAVTLAEHPDVTVSVSGGVAARHPRMSHHSVLVGQADKALYAAKRLGRDRVEVDVDLVDDTLHKGQPGLPAPVARS